MTETANYTAAAVAWVVVIVGAVLAVRSAIAGSRKQAAEKAAALAAAPLQHCLTCGHEFQRTPGTWRGSAGMELALWVLLLWPIAAVYSIWRRLGAGKARVACIVCASNQVVPATAPAARAHRMPLGQGE